MSPFIYNLHLLKVYKALLASVPQVGVTNY